MISNSIELLYDPYEYLTEYMAWKCHNCHIYYSYVLCPIVQTTEYYVNEFQTYYPSIVGRIEEGKLMENWNHANCYVFACMYNYKVFLSYIFCHDEKCHFWLREI